MNIIATNCHDNNRSHLAIDGSRDPSLRIPFGRLAGEISAECIGLECKVFQNHTLLS